MKIKVKDVRYFEIGSQNRPMLWIEPGEEFEVQTELNRGPFTVEYPDGPAVAEKLRWGNL